MGFSMPPKTKRNIQRIIPFGVIWLLIGWFDLVTDALATGNKITNPGIEITLTPEVFIFASVAVTMTGLIIGTLEVYWFKNLFGRYSFTRKLLSKFLFYTFFLFLLIFVMYPLASAIELGISPFSNEIWDRFIGFLGSGLFLSTAISLAFSTFLSLFYAAISDHLGHKVLSNFFTGKYHRPVEEERIFMFLDMKSSTAIAEELGHLNYFELLRAYYDELSAAIVQHEGEVYQYVGDEIVISWELARGLKMENCLNCFFAMQSDLQSKASFFKENYGVSPTFKAGLHVGRVTTGEIGALKREIFFTGDVLNVTARVQSLCNTYNEDLLISGKLRDFLKEAADFTFNSLGPLALKGRVQSMELFSVSKTSPEQQ